MKRALICLALAGILVRLAVLAGAGEALSAWAKEQAPEVSAPPEQTAEPLETDIPVPEAAEPATEASFAALIEEAGAEGETGEPSAEPEAVSAAVLTFSGSGVHNSTSIDIDLAALAAEGLDLRLAEGQPQILIFHTHSSEAYTQDAYRRYEESDPYRTEDKSFSVICVGDALAEKLESYGLTVLHDREIYDYPSYTGSYTRSGAAVEQYLAQYPSIRVVIDLHRDAIGSGDVVYKTQATLDGKTSAQVMLLVGTGENGLWHPYWRENLKLAMYLKAAADDKYPTLSRPIELVSARYNQQLSTGMMILEVGSTGNTLAEALTAVELFGEAAGPALAALME